MRAHVVVVGGGVMGTSIALELARRLDPLEQPVLLLERRELAAGSSGRSGAILRQHYAQPEVASMARDSLRVWTGFERTTGYGIGFLRTGVVTLAREPDDCERVRRNVEMLRSIGVATRLVDGDELKRLVPGISFSPGTVAAYEPDGGCVDPRRAVEAFASLARFHGATVRTGVEVTAFVVRSGRLAGVETTDGAVQCEVAVVAAGPWTNRLLARAGIELPLTVVRPEQHFLAMIAAPKAPQRGASERDELSAPASVGASRNASAKPALLPAAHPVLLDIEHGYYARCEPQSGRTRVGGMDYAECDVLTDPDDFSEDVKPAFQRWAREVLARRIPAYGAQPDAGSLAGWYTLSPDSQPLLGPLPGLEGVFIAAGFSGHGFKLAPSIGEGLARAVLGQPPATYDAQFFAPDRFARGSVRADAGAFGM
jgi:glycine/D-amino acid oxidase-like deaminating enzyme